MSHTRRRHPALRVESEVRIADATARSREAALKLEGHVRVGDHEPERCVPHDTAPHVPQFAQFKS